MKSKLLATLLFALSVQSAYAQSGLSKQAFVTLIIGKWKVTEALVENVKMPASEIGEIIMSFKSDGTYEMRNEGESYNGKWSFNPGTQELLTDDTEGKENHKVLKLTRTSLITQIKDPNETSTMIFTRL